jgi:hypothetical protein
MKKPTSRSSSEKKIRTLGALLGTLSQPWNWKVWRGLAAGAQTQNANLITFMGSWLAAPDYRDNEFNFVYQLASNLSLDGLITHHNGMGTYVSMPEFSDFLRQYQPLPMFSIEDGPEGMHRRWARGDAIGKLE